MSAGEASSGKLSGKLSFSFLNKNFSRGWGMGRGLAQWCIAKNGGGYTQTGVAKGLKVPCLFMITEVSMRCQKNPEVGIRRIPAYTPQYTTALTLEVGS